MKLKKKLIISVLICVVIIALMLVSAFKFNSHILNVREEIISSEKIDDNLNGLIIVYFSDLHYGNNLRDNDYITISDNINKFNPDIIVFGGDLISEKCYDANGLDDFLNGLHAKIAKYAILGDEDINREDVIDILNKSNFNVLRNDNTCIFYNYSYINLVGIEPSVKGIPDIDTATSNINNNYYTVAITHCPDLAKKIKDDKVDYILAGHSLGGQVYIPLINYLYRPLGAEIYLRGKHQIGNALLDISSGLGTIDKDVRLFSNCEIVVYKLKG